MASPEEVKAEILAALDAGTSAVSALAGAKGEVEGALPVFNEAVGGSQNRLVTAAREGLTAVLAQFGEVNLEAEQGGYEFGQYVGVL